jgi:hydrogenase maturation protein HypF
MKRLRVEITGAVQGVGFRPFVYRLAREHGLKGWVINDTRGVFIEVEGEAGAIDRFAERVAAEAPPQAVLHDVVMTPLEVVGSSEFTIRTSTHTGAKSVSVLPDVATCTACRTEIDDPSDRRHRYPFTNCTDCGPRFSIIEELPYDRPGTTMRKFRMCKRCQAEYYDPGNRRFHAQPNACPECGPRLFLVDRDGVELARGDSALERAASELRQGRIVAVKGLGGFHLMVDAADDQGVAGLRKRKGRYEKPLALMVRDLEQARQVVEVSPRAGELLTSARAPIVLLPRLGGPGGLPIADQVAPGNPRLGVMLAYTPLHHLLLGLVARPLVATSGNRSEEPIAIANAEALERLGQIADLFLLHDRPIARLVDDSVVQLVEDEPQPLRRARGLAPLPIRVAEKLPTVLAVGAHLKNTVALAVDEKVFVSQHIGNLETPEALAVFDRVIADFLDLYGARPELLVRDLHPDYPSTLWVERVRSGGDGLLAGLPVAAVQHHHAHLAACLAEHRVEGPALGVTWDGTGYGPDGTVWGGEFLVGDAAGFERVGAVRSFRLPGGEAAVREPRRVATALLWEMLGEEALERTDVASIGALADGERGPLGGMLRSGFRSPQTSSVGRLFDGVASFLDLHHTVAFEGQAAMALEFVADVDHRGAYPLPLIETERKPRGGQLELEPPVDGADREAGGLGWELDWAPLIEELLLDSRRGVATSIMSSRFHRALVEAIVTVARQVGQARVALTGGCFQNRLLSEWAAEGLRQAGFEVLVHRQLPANDGSISFGQAAVAAARLRKGVA